MSAPQAEGSEGAGARGDDMEAGCSLPSEGARLHEEVPPWCWCVTRQDLRELRREVREAVRVGRIVPTPDDDFDPTDREVGPNFYSVVEQYIKPATAASQASWALTRHPSGLACDLFVTHAWVEGIYEFVDKLLASWPRRASNAWICALSMPQHLNISAMISSPRDSPFAKALEVAPQILVVPNRTESIYTRLWCVYEAFLAQQQEKIIVTAMRTRWRCIVMAFARIASASAVGMLSASCFHNRGALSWPYGVHEHMGLTTSLYMLIVVSIFSGSAQLRCVVNWIGAAVASYILVLSGMAAADFAYFVFDEIDHARLQAYKEEGKNLARGFKGSVRHASCSQRADACAIWAEIGCATERVDHTVDVLIRAKQLTPMWSQLAAKGHCVRDVGVTPLAFLAYLLIVQASYLTNVDLMQVHHIHGAMHRVHQDHLWLEVPTILAFLVWLAMLACFETDRRMFSVRVLEKLMSVYFAVGACCFTVLSSINGGLSPPQWLNLVFWEMLLVCMFLVLFLSSIPPVALARVPCLGPCIVSFVLRRIRLHPPRRRPTSCKLGGPSELGP